MGQETDTVRDILSKSLKRDWKSCKDREKATRAWKNFHRGEGDGKSAEYLGLFSAELQPLLDWVLWEEMEKLSSQVLISDQSLQSQPTAKLLYPDSQTLTG